MRRSLQVHIVIAFLVLSSHIGPAEAAVRVALWSVPTTGYDVDVLVYLLVSDASVEFCTASVGSVTTTLTCALDPYEVGDEGATAGPDEERYACTGRMDLRSVQETRVTLRIDARDSTGATAQQNQPLSLPGPQLLITEHALSDVANKTTDGDYLIGETVVVTAGVRTASVLASVTATLGQTQVALSCADQGIGALGLRGYTCHGTIDARNEPHEGSRIVWSARDATGATVQASEPVFIDTLPVVQVMSPSSNLATQGSLSIEATCTDDLGCQLEVLIGNEASYTRLALGGTALRQTFDLSALAPANARLHVTARDTHNQTAERAFHVYIEPPSTLRRIDAVVGDILDVDAHQTLYTDPEHLTLRLKNRDTLLERVIEPGEPGMRVAKATLTPAGALYSLSGYSLPYGVIREERNGEVSTLATGTSSFETRGEWVVIGTDASGDVLNVRTRQLVSGAHATAVSREGAFFFGPTLRGSDCILGVRRGASETVLAATPSTAETCYGFGGRGAPYYGMGRFGDATFYGAAIGDRRTVWSIERPLIPSCRWTQLYDGTSTTELPHSDCVFDDYRIDRHIRDTAGHVLLEGEWLAYVTPNEESVYTARRRSPAGVVDTPVPSGFASYTLALNPTGEAMIRRVERLRAYPCGSPGCVFDGYYLETTYCSVPGIAATLVASGGMVRWLGNRWLYFAANGLFEVLSETSGAVTAGGLVNDAGPSSTDGGTSTTEHSDGDDGGSGRTDAEATYALPDAGIRIEMHASSEVDDTATVIDDSLEPRDSTEYSAERESNRVMKAEQAGEGVATSETRADGCQLGSSHSDVAGVLHGLAWALALRRLRRVSA